MSPLPLFRKYLWWILLAVCVVLIAYLAWEFGLPSIHLYIASVLGIAGVAGNGQDELLLALSGELRTAPGTLSIDGNRVTRRVLVRNLGTEPVINPRTGRRPNVRIIAATNRNLRGLIAQGLFREDLFFRLNVAPVRLPPLRDRTEDIPDLARAFLLRANREGLPSKTIDQSALDRLKTHSWPGNVRELENLIRRVCALYGEDLITARIVERELQEPAVIQPGDEGPVTLSTLVERHLTSYFADQPDGVPPVGLYDRVLEEVERPLIHLALSATRGNQVRAAEILGLNRNTLRKKIQDLGVDLTRGKR